MSDQDSIIQRKFLPVSLLLIGFPPRAQQFASRKPTCAGPTQILLFYYFTILLFYYFAILLFYYFTILLFYYFTILLFYYFTILLFYYFTILLFYYFYGKSGVCISKTQPCMSDQDSIIQRKFLPVSLPLIGFPPRAQQFASRKPTCAGPTQILLFYYLLFYYFTNFKGNREFASGKPNLACRTRILFPEKIPPCLFTFNRISSTGSAVCISKTHLCRSDPDFTILLFYY